MRKRILIDILLLISVFIFPWWIVLLAAVFCVFAFKSFYEIVILGLVIDSLYNAPVARWHGVEVITTLIALALLAIISFTKTKLRYFDET
jgi:hypothetical protein